MNEREAIARLKQGDIGGLEALVHLYQVRAVRTATLITRDRPLAEDIVQAAFVRAYERIGQFDTARPFGPWFLRSIANDAVKAAARRERHVSLEAGDDSPGGEMGLHDRLPDPRPDPGELLAAAETRQAVWAALDELPPAQRAAIVLRYYLGLGEDDMAGRLEVPPGPIKWRLHRARERLLVPPGEAGAGASPDDAGGRDGRTHRSRSMEVNR